MARDKQVDMVLADVTLDDLDLRLRQIVRTIWRSWSPPSPRNNFLRYFVIHTK